MCCLQRCWLYRKWLFWTLKGWPGETSLLQVTVHHFINSVRDVGGNSQLCSLVTLGLYSLERLLSFKKPILTLSLQSAALFFLPSLMLTISLQPTRSNNGEALLVLTLCGMNQQHQNQQQQLSTSDSVISNISIISPSTNYALVDNNTDSTRNTNNLILAYLNADKRLYFHVV